MANVKQILDAEEIQAKEEMMQIQMAEELDSLREQYLKGETKHIKKARRINTVLRRQR